MIISWKAIPISTCEKGKTEIGDFEIEKSTCDKLLGIHLTTDYDNQIFW